MSNTKKGGLTSDQALEELLDGNKRYVDLKQAHPRQSPERRAEIIGGQHPFAVVLTCSDSRVPPEILFDQGLGDIFVVRVAGNVVDGLVQESIEYAAAHLNTPLIMVLGHSQCGAVTATVKSGPQQEHRSAIAAAIQPAIASVKDQAGDLVDNAAKANAKIIAEQLKSSGPVLSEPIDAGRLRIVAAYYDLDTGTVDILS